MRVAFHVGCTQYLQQAMYEILRQYLKVVDQQYQVAVVMPDKGIQESPKARTVIAAFGQCSIGIWQTADPLGATDILCQTGEEGRLIVGAYTP